MTDTDPGKRRAEALVGDPFATYLRTTEQLLKGTDTRRYRKGSYFPICISNKPNDLSGKKLDVVRTTVFRQKEGEPWLLELSITVDASGAITDTAFRDRHLRKYPPVGEEAPKATPDNVREVLAIIEPLKSTDEVIDRPDREKEQKNEPISLSYIRQNARDVITMAFDLQETTEMTSNGMRFVYQNPNDETIWVSFEKNNKKYTLGIAYDDMMYLLVTDPTKRVSSESNSWIGPFGRYDIPQEDAEDPTIIYSHSLGEFSETGNFIDFVGKKTISIPNEKKKSALQALLSSVDLDDLLPVKEEYLE